MDCSCDYDGETIYFHNESVRKAKVAHTCTDCGGVINRGERYTRTSWKDWNGVHAVKRCADCEHLIHEVGRTFYEECGGWSCIYWGDLPVSWDITCDSIQQEKEWVAYAKEAQRIVAMQHVVCAARGGDRKWTLPYELTNNGITESQEV